MTWIIQNKIADLRNQRGVTQEEFAKSVDVSRQTIIALEKGNYVPSLLLAMRISSFFDLPVGEIFTLEEVNE